MPMQTGVLAQSSTRPTAEQQHRCLSTRTRQGAGNGNGNGKHARPQPGIDTPFQHDQHGHQPDGKRAGEPKYILTLKTSQDLHDTMTALRRKYFPPARNKLQAHITLFHALEDPATIRQDLTNLSRFTTPFQLSTHHPQLRGTSILVKMNQGATETCSLRAFLREKWSRDLDMSKQDLQLSRIEPRSSKEASWEAHWTVMNKEPDKERAERSFEELQAGFTVKRGVAEGLSLWEYMLDGTWRHEQDWLFQGGRSVPGEQSGR